MFGAGLDLTWQEPDQCLLRSHTIFNIKINSKQTYNLFAVIENPYQQEAQERWGNTDAYRESAKRLKDYSAEDVEMAKKEMSEATLIMLDAMLAGLPADSPEAMAGAAAHRKSISDWWYDCSYDMHVNLAQMYVADDRFSEFYEKMHPGLAQYVHDAIFANAIANS